MKRFRDPVHGFIHLNSQQVKILDSEVFQRLRGIAQLALTHLVYPGARHSRFEHSLGAVLTARTLAEKAVPNEWKKNVELAALTHDTGHGPFSHVLDGIMKQLTGDGIHEAVSRAVVLSLLADSFEDDAQAQSVADLFDPPKGHRSVAQDVVSGPTDADKLDYLLRDSHYCGVQYGRFDLQRVAETAVMVGGPAESQLGFSQGGLDAVEGLLLARRSMFRQVYRHPVRLATDLMLIRAMEMAIEAGDSLISGLIPGVNAEKQPIIDEAYLDRYLALDDDLVRRRLEELEGPPGELARALRKRDLVHQVVQLEKEDITHIKSGLFLSKIVDATKLTRERMQEIEASIADDLACDRHWIFLSLESPTNPLFRAPGAESTSEDIIITRKGKPDEFFHEMTELLGRPDRPAMVYLSLYSKRQEQALDPYRNYDAREWQAYVINKVAEVLEGGAGV